MCMKAKTPSVTTPAPAPVAQTNDMTQKKDEQWFTDKKRKKTGYDSTILASALNQATGKTTLGGEYEYYLIKPSKATYRKACN